MTAVNEKPAAALPLLTTRAMRRTPLNRAFGLVYSCAVVALFYHHFHSSISFFSLLLMVADAVFAFMRATTESLRLRPVRHQEFPEKLKSVVLMGGVLGEERDYDPPGVDVFICTADPYKEPPLGVVNTALSVLGYEYPAEKLGVYVSDDGGSELTLFAFMEAAKFARHWLPFCRDYGLLDRSPEVYFGTGSSSSSSSSTHNIIKMMYEEMKVKIDSVMERGSVPPEYVMNEHDRQAFNKWTPAFTRQHHPAVIQVLLESGKDKDVKGHRMPNLVYVSREKSRISPHQFKAGALNALLRVSATMTNAAVVLNLDCDTYSNDPQTLLRVLCYLADPAIGPKLAYIQFPQRFHWIGKNDIYGNDHRRLYQVDPPGMDGLGGTRYVGSGCFFQRPAFFGGPSSSSSSSSPESHPHDLDKSISSKSVLASAHHVASCNYEHGTNWGIEIGFRYGSLTEDYKTSYLQQCKGWNAAFCHPERAAFLGGSPFTLSDVLSQNIRWSIGLLEVAASKYSPITYGTRAMGLLMGLAYAHNGFEPTWCLPITTYAYIPQLALLNGLSMFPKVSDPWFYLYTFLFLGAYVQDYLEFILAGGTTRKWWNDQRMWMIRGNSSYLFGSATYLLKSVGFTASGGFNVTSKVVTEELRKRYEQSIFEFGVASTLFVPLTTTAILNLIAFVVGFARVLGHGKKASEMFVQLFISGFVMVSCWPIYEAIAFRRDDGKMPAKITMISILLASILYLASSLALKL
ncbi:cellulose synthase-like protein G3 [Macadamia integrifolia]|uniref:cellulose synthase-like protein G3 n=1 Tax=Macadamia integrifolia TaxID=60698 RepID=UPI001C4F1480|nr:cellulose synthase-like protein G3 [Macadamia integrifolia]